MRNRYTNLFQIQGFGEKVRKVYEQIFGQKRLKGNTQEIVTM